MPKNVNLSHDLAADISNDLPYILTVKQVADLLSVYPSTVHRWIAAGELRAVRMGKGTTTRIYRKDFIAFQSDVNPR